MKKLTKKTENALLAILTRYEGYTNYMIGMTFLRQPFLDDFRKVVTPDSDTELVSAYNVFMQIATETFRWEDYDYLQARTTAEQSFRLFYEKMQFPAEEKDKMVDGFVISFFNQNIDEHLMEWEDAHRGQEYPAETHTEDDIDNIYLSRVFSALSVISDITADRAFCDSIGVRYDYEQLHMCCWFSSQVTNGGGKYSREVVNYSARTTYNRLLNPYSLLWIGVVLGADKEELKAAAKEMKEVRTFAAKCGIVRRHVPFDTIRKHYGKKILEE